MENSTENAEIPDIETVVIKTEDGTENFEFHEGCTQEQKEYFMKAYPDVSTVKTERLHCTSCDKHLGSNTLVRIYTHPVLQVLQCRPCLIFYNSGEFQQGEDGSELHCRWCGQGGEVYCCSKCPSVFCKPCINRNLPQTTIDAIEACDDWFCFRCDSRHLWDIQARCWALQNYAKKEKRATGKPDCPEDRKEAANTDHSTCCVSNITRNLLKFDSTEAEEADTTTQPEQKKSSTEFKSRKRRHSRLKSDKTRNNIDDGAVNAKQQKRAIQPTKTLFQMDGQQEDEVVCTPDIFSCFEEESADDPPPLAEFSHTASNGVGAPQYPSKPRISVRAPETMMQSPNQPMFPTMVPNRPVLCPMPLHTIQPAPNVPIPFSMDMLGGSNNLIQLPDGRLVTFSNPAASYSSPKIIPAAVAHIPGTSAMPPPLLPPVVPVQQTVTPPKTAPVTTNYRRGRGGRYTSAPSRATNVRMVTPSTTSNRSNITVNKTTSTGNKTNPLADQTLSALLQKKLQENPNINRVRMRKIPDWFHVSVQSCLVIARTFITQLMDLQSKAQQMQDSSYDEVKNMHVQLSFLISAIIGKYKNNQLDLNLQLSEWTDALCKSIESAVVEAEPPIQPTPTVASDTVSVGNKCRNEYKEIFAQFCADKKLQMDPLIKLHKFKFQKSTNVFKVKPKFRPMLRTPAIDPNVIQTIDSDTDEEDCAIVPGPEPVLIDLDSDTEKTKDKIDENNSEDVDDPLSGELASTEKPKENTEENNSEDIDDPAVVEETTNDNSCNKVDDEKIDETNSEKSDQKTSERSDEKSDEKSSEINSKINTTVFQNNSDQSTADGPDTTTKDFEDMDVDESIPNSEHSSVKIPLVETATKDSTKVIEPVEEVTKNGTNEKSETGSVKDNKEDEISVQVSAEVGKTIVDEPMDCDTVAGLAVENCASVLAEKNGEVGSVVAEHISDVNGEVVNVAECLTDVNGTVTTTETPCVSL